MAKIKFRFQSKHDNKLHYSSEYGSLETFWSDYSVDGIPKTLGQYTGLKDKNGKEIYEGDVLEGYGFYSNQKILFQEGCFTYGDVGLLTHFHKKCEIIGNIYENK